MSSTIKYPIALKKDTNLLVNISDVESGLKCNCYCFECKEDLIAINKVENIQAAHFRHLKDSNCKGSFESYIHWLTKEIFKEIDCIQIPQITPSHVECQRIKQFEKVDLNQLFDRYNIPKELRKICLSDFILQEEYELNFDQCLIEKTFKTPNGNIKVDIVLKDDGVIMLIEPFLTHKIDCEKKKKIELADFTTLEIDLNPFYKIYGSNFSKEQLIKYLKVDPFTKYWVHFSGEKVDSLLKRIYNEIENDFRSYFLEFEKYRTQNSKIELEKGKEEKLLQKIHILSEELNTVRREKHSKTVELSSLKKEIRNSCKFLDI